MEKVLDCEAFLETKSCKVTMLDPASHMNIHMALGIRGSGVKGKKKAVKNKKENKKACPQESCGGEAQHHFHISWYF